MRVLGSKTVFKRVQGGFLNRKIQSSLSSFCLQFTIHSWGLRSCWIWMVLLQPDVELLIKVFYLYLLLIKTSNSRIIDNGWIGPPSSNSCFGRDN